MLTRLRSPILNSVRVSLPKRTQSGAPSAPPQKVGFIGLGNMGLRMALNLHKHGHSLIVHDVVPAAIAQLEREAGGQRVKVGRSPAHVAAEADVVLTMLPSSPHVRHVYLEHPEALVKGARKGQLLIDSSTIEPAVAGTVRAALLDRIGAVMLDAPVSGGINGAAQGTLTFMVGAQPEEFERARPLLLNMGKNIVLCGPPTCGQVAKVCNNLVLGISMIAVSEALALGQALGMEPKALTQVFNSSSARCWSSEMYNPAPGVLENVPAARGYAGGFQTSLMAKDLSLALSAAQQMKQPLPVGAAAAQLYAMLEGQGYGQLDFGSVFKYLNESRPPKK